MYVNTRENRKFVLTVIVNPTNRYFFQEVFDFEKRTTAFLYFKVPSVTLLVFYALFCLSMRQDRPTVLYLLMETILRLMNPEKNMN